MKIAYFSPLGPQRSGISDYSEELLPCLAEGAKITVFVDGFQPSNPEIEFRFEICDYKHQPPVLNRLESFDAILYHMGNDHRYHTGIYDTMRRHRGVVVFHDFALQDFFLGLGRKRGDLRIYLDEVAACHGDAALHESATALARGDSPSTAARLIEFPLNCRLARGAEAIIVHSDWSRTRFEIIAPGVPVRRVPHHITPPTVATPHRARNGSDPIRIASFGLITPDKGIERILRALAKLRNDHNFHYTLVGEPNNYFRVRALVRRYGLEDRVEITGHVVLEDFKRRINETDIALNLRERTIGETSGSLCRLMAAGVAAIVSDAGWFSELPGDAVVKVAIDQYTDDLLHAYLAKLIDDSELRGRIGANARNYVLANNRIEQSAKQYLAFIREVVAKRTHRQVVTGISRELSSIGVNASDDSLPEDVAAEVASLLPENLLAAERIGVTSIEKQNRLSSNQIGPNSEEGLPSRFAGSAAIEIRGEKSQTQQTSNGAGRLRKIEAVDYKRAAIEYPSKLDPERRHYLLTKPFYNLANKPPKYTGDGMDPETFRHFCDFANIAVALALPAGGRILDVGCGSGWLSEYFARLGYDVKGIDISSELIEMSRERIKRISYGVDHETPLRCAFEEHDIELAPLFEKFDAIICYDSLHHFEDERAVMRHLADMLEVGGLLFILEGERPPTDSPTEDELVGVMHQFGTLESPFDYEYLRALLDEHGFAVVGDYISVNGLFGREMLEGDRLQVQPPQLNYLLCKKVAVKGRPASSVPDSRRPSVLSAHLSFFERWPLAVEAGALLKGTLLVENTGDTLWLVGAAERVGSVMLGISLSDDSGTLVMERHGTPPLPRALAPGESARLPIELSAPWVPGLYTLKLDMVAQHVCWFEERGSTPLIISFEVARA